VSQDWRRIASPTPSAPVRAHPPPNCSAEAGIRSQVISARAMPRSGGRAGQVEVDQSGRPAVVNHDVLWRHIQVRDQLRWRIGDR
jgi:hypothetical protein